MMAILRQEDGTTHTRLEDITQHLSPLKVKLDRWPVPEQPQALALLAKATLSEGEKEELLAYLEHYFQDLQATAGYQSRDLIVLHPDTPNLDGLLAKFEQCHTHADDEVRYIIDGEGVFGFVCPDGSQIELTMQPQEYINVPAGAEHWFHLTAAKRIKAVRYFTDTKGWIPEYTHTPIRFGCDTSK
jgi:1,2-dihydroxy-3-keto-5-methylthiopentene dioxygenase